MNSAHKSDTFLYFAYGSNLLKKRIRISNPSAEYIGIGRLDDHQLDFIKYGERWRGATATIVPTKGAFVWGNVWRINNKDMESLDKQECVDINWYFAKTIEVIMPDNVKVECRTYQQTINPPPRKDNEELPPDRLPSMTYLQVIIQGAMDCQLPENYIVMLKKIPHNGKEASPEMLEKLKQ